MSTSREDLSVETIRSGEEMLIRLQGCLLDESAEPRLQAAFSSLTSRVRINMRELSRINSFGVGMLMRILNRVSKGREITFEECSELVVTLLQMLDFSRYGQIKSFFCRYFCDLCDEETSHLIRVPEDLVIDPDTKAIDAIPMKCACGADARADENLEFLEEHVP